MREVLEETGITVRPLRLTGVYKNIARGVVALVFLCEKLSGEAHPTDEARQVAWMPTRDLEHVMSPAFSVRLLDAIKPEAPFVRTNDGVNLIK